MQKFFQVMAWLLLGTIVVLSLSPPSIRPTTGAPHGLEHLLIFLGTGMACGFGYPRQFGFLTLALSIFAAGIEFAQIWVPGRHARISDFLIDTAAACLGVGLSYALCNASDGHSKLAIQRIFATTHSEPGAGKLSC